MIKTYKDLDVYNLAYETAMKAFAILKGFPKEENYALCSQIRNASRSVTGNIAEGWAKRRYPNLFKRHLTDAIGSANEMLVWIDFSKDCGYINQETRHELTNLYNQIGGMLYRLTENWKSFIPASGIQPLASVLS